MKYSEFKQEVEKMGFVVDDEGVPIYVDKSKDGETLMSIGYHKRFWLDPGWSGFNNLTEDQKLKLYELAYQLAKTPLVEREEEKKYNLISEAPFLSDSDKYYNLKVGDTYAYFGSDYQMGGYQTIFTESELAKMDLTGLKKVEVTPE